MIFVVIVFIFKIKKKLSLSVLIWVQTVCLGYEQKKLVGKELTRLCQLGVL